MYPQSLQVLIERFRQLPGVGEKTAERYALSVVDMSQEDAEQIAQAIMDVKKKLTYCRTCGNLTEQEECEICAWKKQENTMASIMP